MLALCLLWSCWAFCDRFEEGVWAEACTEFRKAHQYADIYFVPLPCMMC